MTVRAVGVILVPRKLLSTTLVTLALAATGLSVTTPAEAAWTRPGDLVKYRLCKVSADGGDTWVFTSRVRRYYATPDARAGLTVLNGQRQVARWRTGWLDRGEVELSRVRVERSPKVRVVISEEAGDRGSDTGTTAQARVVDPRTVRRCG